jgi:hypothetical protein
LTGPARVALFTSGGARGGGAGCGAAAVGAEQTPAQARPVEGAADAYSFAPGMQCRAWHTKQQGAGRGCPTDDVKLHAAADGRHAAIGAVQVGARPAEDAPVAVDVIDACADGAGQGQTATSVARPAAARPCCTCSAASAPRQGEGAEPARPPGPPPRRPPRRTVEDDDIVDGAGVGVGLKVALRRWGPRHSRGRAGWAAALAGGKNQLAAHTCWVESSRTPASARGWLCPAVLDSPLSLQAPQTPGPPLTSE